MNDFVKLLLRGAIFMQENQVGKQRQFLVLHVTLGKINWLDRFGSTFDSVPCQRRATVELIAIRFGT